MDICADDSYKLYVNGEFVAEGPANSYISGCATTAWT
jgi:hypothetical protein